MKNRKLYESIQSLVKGKQTEKKSKRNFAEEYCANQLKRKKLTQKSSTSKIDELMKKFKMLKTYISVDDVMSCVNQLYIEQERETNKRILNTQAEQECRNHRKFKSETVESGILEKAKDALKEYHQRLYNSENQKVGSIISLFQRNSNYLCETMQNKQRYGIYTQFQPKHRARRKENVKNAEEETKDKWNHYTRADNFIKTQPSESLTKAQERKQETLQNYKKKKRLFDLAQIYLQIILEEEHRKKWNIDKDIKGVDDTNLKKKPSILRKSISKQALEPAKVNQNITSMREEQCRGSSEMIRARTGEKSNKMINYKEIAIRKVNSFLLELEEDETSLKNEKKIHLSHLNRLQKHFDDENGLRSQKIWRDEQKYQQIKQVLQKKDK